MCLASVAVAGEQTIHLTVNDCRCKCYSNKAKVNDERDDEFSIKDKIKYVRALQLFSMYDSVSKHNVCACRQYFLTY